MNIGKNVFTNVAWFVGARRETEYLLVYLNVLFLIL